MTTRGDGEERRQAAQRTGYTAALFLLLFLNLCSFAAARADASDLEACRDHERQLTLINHQLKYIDGRVHQYLKELEAKRGVELLVYVYNFDQDAAAFNREFDKLAGETFQAFSMHAKGLAECRQPGGDAGNLETKLIEIYRSALSHLEVHKAWFEDPETKKKFGEYQADARKLLGQPEKENLASLYTFAANVFLKFSQESRAAEARQLWAVAQAVGVKRFSTETGIDLNKNSPESIRKKYQERGVELAEALFNDAPKGAEYPHNYHFFKYEITAPIINAKIETIINSPNIVNRNILAMQALQSESFRGQVNQALGDYRKAMDRFKALAGERFGIENWKDVPEESEEWGRLAQRWAIEQYQLMQRRYEAMQKMIDPKASEDWQGMVKELGGK